MTMTFDPASRRFSPAPAGPTELAIPRGLPAPLPRGERIVWQGAPSWLDFAMQVFHVRAIAIVMALVAAWQVAVAFADGGDWGDAGGRVVVIGIATMVGLGILCAMAWLVQRTTVYTVTSARIIMRIGVAMPKTIDIPFGIVENAAIVEGRDGTGNIALNLGTQSKVAYALLWPHARPGRLREPEPMLRGVPDIARVASLLREGLAASRAAREETTPAPEDAFELRDEHGDVAPRKMITAMAALVLFALALATYGSLTREGRVGADFGTAEHIVPLHFADTGPDAFDLVHADGELADSVIASVAAGREGLLRNTRRALETRRRANGIEAALPYELTRWSSGRLTLHDPHTGQHVRLDFFGRAPEGPLTTLRELGGVAD